VLFRSTYNDNVTLLPLNTTLTSTAGGNITVGTATTTLTPDPLSPVTPVNLVITTTGNATINAAINGVVTSNGAGGSTTVTASGNRFVNLYQSDPSGPRNFYSLPPAYFRLNGDVIWVEELFGRDMGGNLFPYPGTMKEIRSDLGGQLESRRTGAASDAQPGERVVSSYDVK